MGNSGLCLLLFLSLHSLTLCTAADPAAIAASNPTSTTPFIKAACTDTRYYPLCVKCLSPHAKTIQQSERQLARVALAVTLSKARYIAVFVSKLSEASGVKPRESQALRDCVDNMGDSVDQLSQSMEEMMRMNNGVAGQDFMWHMSNVQTWVSAALTDENTCLDGFSDPHLNGNVKATIRRRVVYIGQVTSNALALINRFAARHKSGSTTNMP